MTATSQRVLVVLAWACAGCWLIYCLMLRSQLPADMAIQFSLDGDPNLWLGREMFILLTVLVIAVDAGIFHRMVSQVGDALTTVVVYVFFLFYGGVIGVFWEVLAFNLSDSPIQWLWIGTFAVVSGLITLVVDLAGRMSK
ncbi:MAG: hypothetical protein OXU48_10205 [candidate division Zixibacteria bacterium]|nr:hypothetical protein [candidate division Zixibacteria bacterium]